MNQKMVVIILKNLDKDGKKYRLADNNDLIVFKKAEKYLEEKIKNWQWIENPLPNEEIFWDEANLWVV